MAMITVFVMAVKLGAMTPAGEATAPSMPGPEYMSGSSQEADMQTAQPELYQPEGYQAKASQPEGNGFKVSTVFGGLELESSPQVNRLVQEAEKTARRLELSVDAKVASLKQAAEESVAKMKREVELKVKNEAARLKKDAVIHVIDLINKADEESLKLRKKERERTVLRRLSRKPEQAVTLPVDGDRVSMLQRPLTAASAPVSGRQPIPREWRWAMAKEFNANTLLMKQIIVEGEDAEQLPDFLQRFSNQGAWFDRTLRGTQYVGDTNYRQVVNKQIRLRKVINAQRKADHVLLDAVQKLKLSDFERRKIRLLALYELNAFAQKNLFKVIDEIKVGQPPRQVDFTDPVIRHMVLKVANEVTGRVKGVYSDFKVLDDKAVIQLAVGLQPVEQEAEIKKLRSMIDVAAQEKDITKRQMKQKLEEQSKELSEHQLTAKQLEGELDRLRKQAEVDKTFASGEVQERMKREFRFKLEEKERDSLDLKLQLTSAHQRLDVLDRQVKEAKDNLDRMNVELLMAKDEAQLAKKHVEDLQREVEEQRKVKNLALDKVKLIDEVADRRIDEHVAVVTQRLNAERQDARKLEGSFKAKEEALKKAERDYQDKERLLSKKEQEIEEQRTLLDGMRKSMAKDRDVLSDIRDETKVVMNKFSQLAREHEKEMASIKGSTRVVTEAANRQALKAELKEKKQEQAVVPKTDVQAPMVIVPTSTLSPVSTPQASVAGSSSKGA